MISTRKITIGILVTLALLLIGWDIFVAANDTKGDTISEVFLYFSKHPVLPFAAGVVMGHLCWPQYRKEG